ncbi:loricrin-like [Mustela putorius furo]|uniref:Loricrin-like n=1 Tax=Mustela putorius furo TaxID=9669 RepID=A0A8U0RLR6_MUSPF|nr:loricrin-like [Mustela putorius furo]
MPPMPEGGGGRGEERQSKWAASSEAFAGKSDKWDGRSLSRTPPHPTAPLACAGQAFPKPVFCRFLRKTWKRKGSGRAEVLERRSYLEASGEESEDDLWFRGETGVRAAAGAGGGTGTCGGRSGQRRGARGDGCPARRPSGSAAAAPLGLTAGPEPQRSGGGDGGGSLTILPRGPVPSNRHRPRCGSAGGSSLTFPAGGASARCPGPGGGGGDDVGRGGREGGRVDPQRQQEKEGEGGGAAGAGAAAARAALWYPRWVPVNAPFSLLLSISPGG